MSDLPGDPGLPPDETRAAGALLSAAWGERTAVLGAEALRDRTHVFRLRLDGGRSAVLKRRVPGGEGFGIELAALECLNAMPEPVAPRLLGADAEVGILLMEDLGPGRSLADSVLTDSRLAGSREAAQADLIAYARMLGALHAWSRDRAAEFAALRARHAPEAALAPAWLGAVGRGQADFLAVAATLGLPTAGVENEIKTITDMTNGVAYPGLVHGDACPDNMRLRGRDSRIFDFESSGGVRSRWTPPTCCPRSRAAGASAACPPGRPTPPWTPTGPGSGRRGSRWARTGTRPWRRPWPSGLWPAGGCCGRYSTGTIRGGRRRYGRGC
jgi:hypothetical protein